VSIIRRKRSVSLRLKASSAKSKTSTRNYKGFAKTFTPSTMMRISSQRVSRNLRCV